MSLTLAQQQALASQAAQVQTDLTALTAAIAALPVETPVTPPVTPSFAPNQPAGLTVISDYAFPDALTPTQADVSLSDGWHSVYNGGGNGTILPPDPTAPFPLEHIYQVRYPQGFVAGSAPVTLYRNLPGLTRLYVAFAVKVSVPWQGNPDSVNKLCYFFTSVGSLFFCFYGAPGSPYHLRAFPQFAGVSLDQWLTPNVDSRSFPIDGQWHQVECYADHSGVVAFALDGVIVGNYSGVPMPTMPFNGFNVAPVWGGVDGVKAETDDLWFQHLRVAGA